MRGEKIDLQPTTAPSLVVSVANIAADPSLTVGAPVTAGSTKLGTLLDLAKVETQTLARYTNDAGQPRARRGAPRRDARDPVARGLRILFVGDVFGAPGRRAVESRLPSLREELAVDFCVVNGENAADGRGITAKIAERLLASGADVVTLGNWVWGQQGFAPYLSGSDRVLRPANLSPRTPGRGLAVHDGVAVINLLGQMTLNPFESAFLVAERLVEEALRETPVVIVDFHAEATSEKVAMAYHLEGRATAVIGTHTHVQTNDARVLRRRDRRAHRRRDDRPARLRHRQPSPTARSAASPPGSPVRLEVASRRRADRGRAGRVRGRRARHRLRARARARRAARAEPGASSAKATNGKNHGR